MLLELDGIDPESLTAEDWLVLRLHQSGDDCNLLWEYETLDIDIRIVDENERRIDRVFYGQTATAKGETNPPGKTLTWSIPTQTDGVEAEIGADSGIITVKPNSGKGWIVVRATHGDAFRDAAVYTDCMNCDNCDNASGGFVTLSSVDARLNMGKAENGLAAGHVTLVADSLSSETYTPKALGFSTLADGVEALRDSNGLRQVMAPEALADVVALGDDSFEVRFYTPGDVEGKSGEFYETDPSASPMAVWRVENPSEGDGFDRLKISEIRDGRTTAYEFSYDDESREWSLQEGNGLRTVARRETTDISRKERAVVETVRNASGEVASATRTVFRDFGRGESVVEETVDPDGAALTTTYEYFEDSSLEGSFGKVKSVERPDGSWTKYLYDDEGRIASETNSWLDLAAGATSATARTAVYDYNPVDPNDADSERNSNSPRTVVEYIEGKAVSRTFHSYMEQPDGGRIRMVERCAAPDASFGDPGNLRTVTWYYGPDTAKYEVGRVAKVLHPDGRMDTYAYETGTWFDGSFRPGDGSDIRETAVRGTEDFPEGVPGKTTMDVSVSDRLGRSIASETHVRTENGYERISWTEYEYDQRGNQIGTRSSDGSRTESAWGCCGKESDRDASGILTTYEYDDLRRLVSSSRESLDGDIVTTYEYDATGRRLSQTVSAGGLGLTTRNDYDDAGRLVRTVDAAGLATTYQYSDDGLTTTVTRPGGATEITERHLDSQVESVTGTAVVDRFYFYGVDPDGTRWTETRVGRPDSPMFERTRTDCLGRAVKTETAAFEGASKTTEYEYDDKGRLIRTSTTGQADTLYAYDELGNQYRSGLDVDGNSQLIPASDDRITESETAFAFVDDAWWQQTVQTVYPESGSEDSVEVSQSLSRLTGLGTDDLVSESVQIDIHGKRTVSRSSLDRETRTRTDTTDHPDSDTDSETVGQYGLITSSTSKTGLTTTFGYDAMGRRTETADPRTGTSLAHYDASGRPDWTEDAAGNRTSYSYDPSTGLRIAEYNPEGKATRHIYNARGQITHTWGDVPYPVRYVYDDYGRLSQMHTFRTGENWSFGMWPTGLEGEADVTTWHYDEASGLLAAKEYADGARTTYTYDTSGNLETRTWARLVDGSPLVTAYSYDPATAELAAIDYSDSTPDIAFAYDRLGRQKTITDAAGTRTFAYDEHLRLESETLTGLINHTITRTYDSADVPGRSTGFTLSTDESTPDSPEYTVTYGYDESGRFETLSWNVDTDPASDTDTPSTGTTTYSYLPNSDLLQGYATSTGGSEGQHTTYAYEPHRNLKTMVENAFGSETISRYEYEYDTLGRRTTVLNTGAAFDQPAFERYQYDDRSQLVSAARYLGSDISNTDTPVDDRHRDYAYDPIGNRVNATEGTENPEASKTLTYTSNQLNQYDLITETNGATQTNDLAYDPDGNLVSGLDDWIFSYNAENRLVSAEPETPILGNKKCEFAYDYMGRRIQKLVYEWDGASWILNEQILFAYDGWNLIEEITDNGTTRTSRSFVWALDLSQSFQGAGGVGGLIASFEGTKVQYFCADGNGNIGQLVNSEDGSIAAHYEFDPFGNAIVENGSLNNAFRFSTKYWDEELELCYYGLRYYSPGLGRWVTRDPSGIFPDELTELNAYSFVNNASINNIDVYGLFSRTEIVVTTGEVSVAQKLNPILIFLTILFEAEEAGDPADMIDNHPELVVIYSKEENERECGPLTRQDAFLEALIWSEHNESWIPIPWSDYNGTKGPHYRFIRQQYDGTSDHYGYYDSRIPSKGKIRHDCEGHLHMIGPNDPKEHKCPHIHAIDPCGEEEIFKYKWWS